MNKIVDLLLRLLPGRRTDPDSLEARSIKAFETAEAKLAKYAAKGEAKLKRLLEQTEAAASVVHARLDQETKAISDAVQSKIETATGTAALLAAQLEGVEGLSFLPTDSREYIRELREGLEKVADLLHPADREGATGDDASGD
jgi:hypothetical protein